MTTARARAVVSTCAAALLALGTPARAEPVLPAPTEASPVAAPDPERRALAAQLQVAIAEEAASRQAFELVTENIGDTMFNGSGQQAEAARRVFKAEMRRVFEGLLPKLLAHSREQLATTFTASELAELVAFYQSEAGRRWIAELPRLTAESARISRELGEAAIREASPAIREKMRTERLIIP